MRNSITDKLTQPIIKRLKPRAIKAAEAALWYVYWNKHRKPELFEYESDLGDAWDDFHSAWFAVNWVELQGA